MKKIIKRICAQIPAEYFIKASSHSIINQKFSNVFDIKTFESKDELWSFAVQKYFEKYNPITYVEFGVFEGHSIKYFAEQNNNKQSLFIGLDSFEGLPSDWGNMPKGYFDTKGLIPNTNDRRIRFVKGWFQNIWNDADSLIRESLEDNLFVHYDADLYTSTLFALTKIDEYGKEYYAIFDEFFNKEMLALDAYINSYNATVEFIAKTDNVGYPNQLLCKITPKRSSAKHI